MNGTDKIIHEWMQRHNFEEPDFKHTLNKEINRIDWHYEKKPSVYHDEIVYLMVDDENYVQFEIEIDIRFSDMTDVNVKVIVREICYENMYVELIGNEGKYDYVIEIERALEIYYEQAIAKAIQ